MLLHILVYGLFALSTALHYTTAKAQDEKLLADETLYSTCSSLFPLKKQCSNLQRNKIHVNQMLCPSWLMQNCALHTMVMESDHFLVY